MRSTLGLAVSRGISGTLIVLASVLVARAGGVSTLGVFGLALTAGTYASVVADAGVSAYLLPELGRTPRDRWPQLWADVLRFEVRSALPFVALYLIGVGVLTHGSVRLALLAVAPWWVLLRVNGAARSFFTVAEQVGAEAAATVAESIVSLAVVGLVLLGSREPALATLGLSAGAAIGFAVRVRGLHALGIAGGRSARSARSLTRAAVPFAGFTILTTLYLRIDVVLLGLLASTRDIGLYQPAVRFATALIILPDALASVLLGRAARAPASSEVMRRQQQALTIGVPAGLLLVALCALFGKPALGALYGPQFRASWVALTLLAATVPVALVAAVNGNALTAHSRQGTRVVCLGAAFAAAVCLGIPAIALWGYNGAAAVSLVNEVVLVGAYAVALTAAAGRKALVLPRASTA